jgi:hypothetical protein
MLDFSGGTGMSESISAQINRELVDSAVCKLFAENLPVGRKNVLCIAYGVGIFVEGIIRWCRRHQIAIPNIRGIELDREYVVSCKKKFSSFDGIHITASRLYISQDVCSTYDYMLTNFYNVSSLNSTLIGYNRDFLNSLEVLLYDGTMVAIVPTGLLYFPAYSRIRFSISWVGLWEIDVVDDTPLFRKHGPVAVIKAGMKTFSDESEKLVTITVGDVIQKIPRSSLEGASPWIQEKEEKEDKGPVTKHKKPIVKREKLAPIEVSKKMNKHTLSDVCYDIRWGPSTGADNVFVLKSDNISPELRPFAFNSVSSDDGFRGLLE